MSDHLEKRSQWLGPDYYEGKVDGRNVVVTPERDFLGNSYYRVEVEGKAAADTLGASDNQPDGGYAAADPIADFFTGLIFRGFGVFLCIPFVVAAIGLLAVPGVAWKAALDSAQGHEFECAVGMLCAAVGGIAAFLTSRSAKRNGASVFPRSVLVGVVVSGILFGGWNVLYSTVLNPSGYFSAAEYFAMAGALGLLLGIIPSVIGCVIGCIPQKRE